MSTKQEQQLDQITAQIAANPDLREDVLPFLLPTFVKLKQIAHFIGDKPNDNVDAFYEFNNICGNYLPSTINSFCQLPVEFRNTKILRNNQTARELLIEDLKKIIDKTSLVEEALLSKEEKAFLANNIYLASRLGGEKSENKFENRFDYKTWSTSPEASGTYIVPPQPQMNKEEKSAEQYQKEKDEAVAKAVAQIKEAQEEKRLKLEQFKEGVYNTIGSLKDTVLGFLSVALPISMAVSVVGAAGYGLSIPLRSTDNKHDIQNELSYVVSTIGERRDMTRPELEALKKRVEAMHEENVGDYFPLKVSVGDNNSLTLNYKLKNSCESISYFLFEKFFNNDINASFKIDGLEYASQWVKDNTQFENLAEYAQARMYNQKGGSSYYRFSKTLEDDKSLLTGKINTPARNLANNPVVVPIASNGVSAEGFRPVCKPDVVELEVKISPNETIPVYQPKAKPKM